MSNAPYGSYETLQIRVDRGIHHLTLNRPARLNAISAKMANELTDYFRALQNDHAVRVVVLRGAGRHFCAGLDLTEAAEIAAGVATAMRTQQLYAGIVQQMRRCPQPIIALIQGAASGGGLALALASDVRFASDDARMNVAMARVGLTGCDMGISYFLPRAIGTSNAAELMMGGRFINAQKALRTGLVSEVVAREELDALADAMAADMLRMAPLALRLTKDGLNVSQDSGSLDAAIAVEDRNQVLCIGPYLKEGATAFLEKRAPNYPDN